jgi:hypothetical protein
MAADNDMNHALNDACALGDEVRILELINAGADVNFSYHTFGLGRSFDYQCYWPLQAAIDGGHIRCVRILLQNGADPTTVSSSDCFTDSFLLAIENDNAEILYVLLNESEAGRGFAEKDIDMFIEYAEEKQSASCLQYLLSIGQDMTQVKDPGFV